MNFGIGQQLFAVVILKKKKLTHVSAVVEGTTLVWQRSSLYNRACMCKFLYIFKPSVPFFNAVYEELWWYVILSIAVVQPHLYLQYFLSWLYNRACKPYITAIKCLFSTSVKIV